MALVYMGVKVNSTYCLLCDFGFDEVDHFLVSCHFARNVMDWIYFWCGVPSQRFDLVREFINYAANWGHCPKMRKIFIAIYYGLLWSTWKERNDIVFNKIRCSLLKLADNVVTMVFSFMVHRRKFGNCTWANWSCNHFSIM